MKIAYFDTFSGASGDMILGALLDAGLELAQLQAAPAPLGVGHYHLEARKESRGGIAGTRFIVHLDEGHEAAAPGHAAAPGQAKDHHAGAGHHHHGHRSWGDIRQMIERASLPPAAQQKAIAIFTRLAEAEAAIHGTTPEAVHFHEVGAVDSIVDIVGTALALELLGIERLTCSPIPTGSGTVVCEHGTFPVPAPATAALLKGVPLAASAEQGELTTPTGAAILSTLAAEFGPLPAMTVRATGYGAGRREGRTVPNLLRVFIGDAAGDAGFETDSVWVIETNIDDAPAEVVADAAQRLLAAGALDVYTAPITMKKGRSGVLLACLAHESERVRCEELLFAHTSTFGVRRHLCARSMLARRHETVRTRFGEIRVKLGLRGSQVVRVAPEFEDCRRAAEAAGASVQAVMQEALRVYGGGK